MALLILGAILPSTRSTINRILKGKHFSKAVDLGCGEGIYSERFKQHTDYLIGVDHNPGRLSIAEEFASYDEVVCQNINEYDIPPGTEAVFMIDVIEHLPKYEGSNLIARLRRIPFLLIVTPLYFRSLSFRNGHQSLWTEEELNQNGLNTMVYNSGIQGLFTPAIVAWREC